MPDEIIRLTRNQVREYDRRAIADYHIPGIVLMENAARGVADATIRCFHPKSVLIVAGNGNNGGDGYAVAPMLRDAGVNVSVFRVDPAGKLSPDAAHYYNALLQRGVPLVQLLQGNFDLVIDAIFGTGLTRPPELCNAEIIQTMNALSCPILAVDLPSGLDCDTGEPLGPCIRAAKTVTFVAEKTGFANPRSREYTGEVIVAGIGAPHELLEIVRNSPSPILPMGGGTG